MLDLADPAFLQPLDAGAIVEARGHLRAKLGDDAFLDGSLGQEAHFGDVVAQGLLTIDVLAFLNCAVGSGEMRVIGHRHIHRVDPVTFFIEQLPPVRVHACAGHGFGRLVEVVGVHIAERHNLHPRVLKEVLQVHPAHAADPDAGVMELAVGGNDLGRRQRAGARQEEWRGDAGRRRRP